MLLQKLIIFWWYLNRYYSMILFLCYYLVSNWKLNFELWALLVVHQQWKHSPSRAWTSIKVSRAVVGIIFIIKFVYFIVSLLHSRNNYHHSQFFCIVIMLKTRICINSVRLVNKGGIFLYWNSPNSSVT